METFPSAERAKPFRLVKYFSFISLVLIFIGAMVLSSLNIHWAKQMQIRKSEDYALLLVENLNHQIYLRFFLPVFFRFGKIQTSNPEQFELLDRVVRSTLHSFKVVNVNIYDKNNIISYSFNKDVIGKKHIAGKGYQEALNGQSQSRIVQRKGLMDFILGLHKESRIITFAPLRAEKPLVRKEAPESRLTGPILGVVEIVQDLTEDYNSVVSFQRSVILTSSLVMGILLLVLISVVKRGESIIRRRATEQLLLEERLSRSKHLSALGEMTAGISHEIRNPLGIIRSSAELLKKKMAVFDPSNPIPDVIVEESARLNNIITDFLNYAKPKTPNLTACRIQDVLNKNLTYLMPQIKKQGHHIVFEPDDDLPEIVADGDLLYQAFLNILINAMQAMPTGGDILLTVESRDNVITTRFVDGGEGISEELMEKIWDPFFTTKEMGTGLGLGLVKNIIEAHGGTIQISNNLSGQGAEVTVELPIQPHN